MNMEPMSWPRFILNNPEWVGVLASSLFAVITIGAIVWQGCVMMAQKRVMQAQVDLTEAQKSVMESQLCSSASHERIQIKLIHLQHEHEWLLRLNAAREEVLKLGRKLHVAAGCLVRSSDASQTFWQEVQDTVYELSERLRILDVRIYSGAYDNWYPRLAAYVDAIQIAVINDEANLTPSDSTRTALKDANDRFKPLAIFLDLEGAIRMEFLEFKDKWDAALPS
jgi:hypothetical protein